MAGKSTRFSANSPGSTKMLDPGASKSLICRVRPFSGQAVSTHDPVNLVSVAIAALYVP